jgi:cytoskeleton protein RodZ
VSEQSAIKEQDVESSNIEARFPGYILRNAREVMGLSQQELSRQLHLTSRVLEGIETDDFSPIPSAIFARGYIRNYARYVGADSDMLIGAFDQAYGRPDHIAKPMATIKDLKKQANPSDTWVKVSTGLFLVIVVVLTRLWWQSQNGPLVPAQISEIIVNDEQGDAVVASTESTGIVIESASQAIALESEQLDSDGAQVSHPNVVQELITTVDLTDLAGSPDDAISIPLEAISESAADMVSDPISTAEVSAVNEGQLVMVFDKDCWVEVKDGDGNILLTDLISSGQRVDIAVKKPVQILLGRASALTAITFNGTDINLAPHIRKDVARVTLGQ